MIWIGIEPWYAVLLGLGLLLVVLALVNVGYQRGYRAGVRDERKGN